MPDLNITLSVFDVFCMAVCLFFALCAMISGFMKEFFSKLALVAGIGAALCFCRILAARFGMDAKYRYAAVALAFVLIFIAVYVVVRLVQKTLSLAVRGEILGSLDHILGFALGVAEGALILCAAIFISRILPWNLENVYSGSLFYRHVYLAVFSAEFGAANVR